MSKRSRRSMAADPFDECTGATRKLRLSLLGRGFEFESEEPRLLQLVRWAYAGLPPHRLATGALPIRVRLRLARDSASGPGAPTPRLVSGAGLLGACTGAADLVLLSPRERAALVVIPQARLSSPYLARYESIEFAVCTLAARVQRLVALHGACVGVDGRGVLLLGASGAGKSTVMLHALLDGFEALSEDSVFVAPRSLTATGAANFLHLRPDAALTVPVAMATRIRQSPVIRRRSGIQKHEVDLRDPPFRLARRPLRIAGVVLLSAKRAGKGVLLRRLRRDDALARLQDDQPYAASQPGWSDFRRRIASLPAFELRRGDAPCEAVDALREVLREAPR